jgi:two-component system, chemotaxis family, protein-glutamate methylesterase/glutaminase
VHDGKHEYSPQRHASWGGDGGRLRGRRAGAAIRSRVGAPVVQHPDDALYPGTPINALQAGVVDHQVTAINVGALLAKLAVRDIQQRDMEPDEGMEIENRIAMGRRFSTSFDAEALGPHSGYTCPDCNGSLMSVSDNNYRCRVGHAWTADALLKARHGMLHRRYTDLADEAERAVTVTGRRLSEATSRAGERGDG